MQLLLSKRTFFNNSVFDFLWQSGFDGGLSALAEKCQYALINKSKEHVARVFIDVAAVVDVVFRSNCPTTRWYSEKGVYQVVKSLEGCRSRKSAQCFAKVA